MTAAALLDQLESQGGRIERGSDGKLRLRGPKLPEALQTALKASRDEVIEELERRTDQNRDRYGKVPTEALPLQPPARALTEQERACLLTHVLNQPRITHAWVMARANQYWEELAWPMEQCDPQAVLDLVAWQRQKTPEEAVRWVLDMNEAVPQ